jgi:hypothetical protein
VVTVVNAAERAVMEKIRFQKTAVRKASRAVISGSWSETICFGAELSMFLSGLDGIPSGSMPMLSGDRWMPKQSGNPATRNNTPARNAAQRQPNISTAIESSGVMMAPPTGTAALTTVIARARRRMNQLLATTVGACTKPAVKASEMTPR